MITDYPQQLVKNNNPFYTLSDVPSFSQGFTYYHKRFPILMHSHNFYELNVVTKGELRHYFNKKSHPAKTGDVFMIPPYVEHGYWTSEDARIYHLIIKSEILTEYKTQLNNYPGIKILFEVEPQIRQSLNNLSLNVNLTTEELSDLTRDFDELIYIDKNKPDDKGTLFDLKTVCLLCKLARLISQKFSFDNRKDEKNADYLIVRTTQYMEENYFSKISVDDLSRMVNMSTPSFFRYFKKAFDMSPMEYLKKIRISHATAMLASTDKSISFIAQECGFFDSSHFTHVFEEATNMTPKEFRKHANTW